MTPARWRAETPVAKMPVDSARGIAYFVTASAKDEFYGADRVGKDLYSDCLLAINARTGKIELPR